MKKTIASIGALLLLAGCSMGGEKTTNPDQVNFDENYQGSPEIDQKNANDTEMVTEETPVEIDPAMLETLPPVPPLDDVPADEETTQVNDASMAE